MNFEDYEAFSFDCYGTLIDWEAGIAGVLAPWAREQGLDSSDEELLQTYADHEAAVEHETPTAPYPEVLAAAFRRIGGTLGRLVSDDWARRLGASVAQWPAFPDSADTLARLAKRYKLIILSNVHRDGFAASNRQLRGEFAAVITAQDVGSYKPSPRNFDALRAEAARLGIGDGKLLHVAQSLFHDHVPAQRAGLRTVWINRRHDRAGWGATPAPSDAVIPDAQFPSMAAFATAAGC